MSSWSYLDATGSTSRRTKSRTKIDDLRSCFFRDGWHIYEPYATVPKDMRGKRYRRLVVNRQAGHGDAASDHEIRSIGSRTGARPLVFRFAHCYIVIESHGPFAKELEASSQPSLAKRQASLEDSRSRRRVDLTSRRPESRSRSHQ